MPLLCAHNSVTVYVTALSVSPSLRWHSAQLRPCVFGPRSVSHALSFSAAVGVALRVVCRWPPLRLVVVVEEKVYLCRRRRRRPSAFCKCVRIFLFGVWICADLVRLAQFIYNIQRLRSACANRVDSTHTHVSSTSPSPTAARCRCCNQTHHRCSSEVVVLRTNIHVHPIHPAIISDGFRVRYSSCPEFLPRLCVCMGVVPQGLC